MAEPVKQPAIDNFESNAVRLRSSSEGKPRDIGSRRDKPTKSAKSRPSSSARSGGSGSGSSGARGGSPARADRAVPLKKTPLRNATTFTRAPGRPRDVKPSGGAKIIAPVALVLCVIACFAVVNSRSDDSAKEPATVTKKSSTATSGSKGGSVATTTRSTYKVKAGDSFAAISEKLNLDANKLAELNPDVDPRALQPGQKLKLK